MQAIRKRRKRRCGRHGVDPDEIQAALRNVPVARRGTLRDAAEATVYKNPRWSEHSDAVMLSGKPIL